MCRGFGEEAIEKKCGALRRLPRTGLSVETVSEVQRFKTPKSKSNTALELDLESLGQCWDDRANRFRKGLTSTCIC